MRVANAAVEAHAWRIHEIAPDFRVEDVWALPVQGAADDFPALLDVMLSLDFADAASLPVRALWGARDLLGRWFDLGRIAGPDVGAAGRAAGRPRVLGPHESTLVDRLPDDLRDTAAHLEPRTAPFFPLYLTDDEYAAELSNRTMHGVIHLTWVDSVRRPLRIWMLREMLGWTATGVTVAPAITSLGCTGCGFSSRPSICASR